MAIEKLNKTVVSGERARATDFNDVTSKVDEIIDSINGVTGGTIVVPKAVSANSSTSATTATTASNAVYDGDGNKITDTYATKSAVDGNATDIIAIEESIAYEYDYTKTYSKGEYVRFLDNSLYICTVDGTKGIEPSYTSNWQSADALTEVIRTLNTFISELDAEQIPYDSDPSTIHDTGSIAEAVGNLTIKFDNSILDVSSVLSASVGDTLSGFSTILDNSVRLYATVDGIFVDVLRGITSGGNHMICYHYLNSANELQTQIQMFTISDGVITITYEGDQ